MLDTIQELESNVRGYVRLFPTVFDVARGSELWDIHGKRYIDFFCGAGTLNYGHNNPRSKNALLEYIQRDGIQHSLDTATAAKTDFLDAFENIILRPRDLDYRVQFTGPTGTNAVEAAIKLARISTQRSHVIAFTHAYHGHSLGSLTLTANRYYHSEYIGSRNNVSHLPFDGYCKGLDSAELLDQILRDKSSGTPLPAAIILETIQGEGGINVASVEWLKKVEAICREHEILLIVDDIQVGNGRSGTFFSFERAGISPDLVCLSKSLGGGLPISIVLIRPDLDVWKPGQHTGTFRGNNLAFVAARSLLEYWRDDSLSNHIARLTSIIEPALATIVQEYPQQQFQRRGLGLIQGLDVRHGELARRIIEHCFESGMLIEASGAEDEVLKIMPALNTPESIVKEGLHVLSDAIRRAVYNAPSPASPSLPQLAFPIGVDGIAPIHSEVLD